MKKMLMLASVASMIDQFNIPNIEILQQQGYEVHVACNFEKGSTCSAERISELKKKLDNMNVPYFQIDFSRNVLKINEVIRAYKQVQKLCKQEKYDFIHCHSPIGGVIGRLVGHATKTKVVYTAHGFHFYKGAPLINWLVYYPIEKWMSRYTDILITINQEDYKRAQKFSARCVEYIPGIGVDIKKFSPSNFSEELKTQMRQKLGITNDTFVLFSVGELSERKNHEIIIKALEKFKQIDIKYVIAGTGSLKKQYMELARRLGIEDKILLLGYRTDIKELCYMADVFVHPSKREGLGIAALEGMAMGLPLISSNINGIMDYAIDNETGFCCKPNDVERFEKAIYTLYNDNEFRKKCGEFNLERVKKFDISETNNIMEKIYNNL